MADSSGETHKIIFFCFQLSSQCGIITTLGIYYMFGVVMKDNTDRYLENINNDFRNGIAHGILVANLSYELAIRMGLSEERAYKTVSYTHLRAHET